MRLVDSTVFFPVFKIPNLYEKLKFINTPNMSNDPEFSLEVLFKSNIMKKPKFESKIYLDHKRGDLVQME